MSVEGQGCLPRPPGVRSLVWGYGSNVPVLQLHLGAREVAVVPEAHLGGARAVPEFAAVDAFQVWCFRAGRPGVNGYK